MEDAPDILKHEAERLRRSGMMTLPHIKTLANYVASIKMSCGEGYEIPNFDPLDGGVHARALFLLEAPGPKAAPPTGSGFVSRNNPDPTAENLWNLMKDANIHRTDTLIWNIVPWYVGEQGHILPVTKQDIQEALPYLRQLLNLLPRLQVIVLVGKKAQSAVQDFPALTSFTVVPSPHPSARVFHRWPGKKRQAQEAFAAVALKLQDHKEPTNAQITDDPPGGSPAGALY